jgi:uncharacterized SAM-binding protein YcdF (DUF218 family)
MSYLQPILPVLLLLLAAGFWRMGRGGFRRFWAGCWLALLLCSWTPVAWLTSASLEGRYPVRRPATGGQAIVVLGEGLRSPAMPWDPEVLPSFRTYRRCRYAAWLYHNGWNAPILVSGGGAGTPVAEPMVRVLQSEGAAPTWVDTESANTYENARNAARLLLPQGIRRIILVTDASHMPRAEACFRKQGFLVQPAPCGYLTLDVNWNILTLVPRASALDANSEIVHEWLGLAWYRVSGKI